MLFQATAAPLDVEWLVELLAGSGLASASSISTTSFGAGGCFFGIALAAVFLALAGGRVFGIAFFAGFLALAWGRFFGIALVAGFLALARGTSVTFFACRFGNWSAMALVAVKPAIRAQRSAGGLLGV